MKKGRILLISALMGVALIGLVVLQLIWIRHDLNIKEQKFEQQVLSAMKTVVGRIETGESVKIISHEFPDALNDSIETFFDGENELVMPAEAAEPRIEDAEEPRIEDAEELALVESVGHTSPDTSESSEIYISATNKGKSGGVSVTVISDGKGHSRTMAKMPAPEKLKHLEKTAGHLTLSTEKIKIKLEKMEKVIQKMAFEFGSKEFTLKDRIDPLKLDSALRKEFQNNGIDLNYGISLKTGTADSVVWERKIDNAKSKQFQTQLFPDDIINKNDRLQVAFPDTFRYFISTMWWMLSGSLLFTLIIIFAFAYTLQVIFKQKKISEIRNDFINNMTHEFKTPIATIRLAADALSNPAVASQSDKVNYYSDIIKEENERMNSHVESILNMALFDKNQFIPNPQVTDLHELLNQVIKSMQLQAGARGGTIATKFSAKNVYVSADLQFLPVVFMNLIDNAIKYSDRAPEVEVETFDSQNGIQVTVKDNGVGMDAGTLKQVFEKFYRVPTGNLHQVKGFGLGLSYARAIVVAHGGTISASSVPSSGSAFKVELPSSSSIA